MDTQNFTFTYLSKQELLEMPFCGGVEELRNAIASHLFHFRGMTVDKNQIIVGAGTEYLYELLIKLLGKDRISDRISKIK